MAYTSFSDTELVALLKEGDQPAYTVIYHKYFDSLYLHVCQRLGNAEEAKDIIHELFAQLWNKRDHLQIKSSLSGYLHTAVRNRVLDYIAHQQTESRYVESLQGYLQQGYYLTDHLIREKQLNALIDQGINELPPKMKIIFELSRKEVLSNKEIAQKLGLSEQTVKKQIHYALKILRGKLATFLFLLSI